MKQIRISAKNLGELALPNFCPRCFWLKLHVNNKLPYQIFPGIFSSIDTYSKKITNKYFERYRSLPWWFNEFGIFGRPVSIPSYNKFNIVDRDTNILLTGVPDEIIKEPGGTHFIVDYKTAKLTSSLDVLLPMYEVQLNVYAYIGREVGFCPISGLGLLYYQPFTNLTIKIVDEFINRDGFFMYFSGKFIPVDINPKKIPFLLRKTREIYDYPKAPEGVTRCKNCQLLEHLFEIGISRD